MGILQRIFNRRPPEPPPVAPEVRARAADETSAVRDLVDGVVRGERALDELRGRLRIIVRDERGFGEKLADLHVRPVVDQLVEAVVIDSPNALVFVRRSAVFALQRPDALWFDDACENTRRVLATSLARGPVELPQIKGAEQFGGDNASAMLALGGDEKGAPSMWIVPARGHAIRYLPPDGGSAMIAAPILKHFAGQLALQSKEPLSADVFARVHGVVRSLRFGLVTTDTDVAVVDSSGDLAQLADDAFPSDTLSPE